MRSGIFETIQGVYEEHATIANILVVQTVTLKLRKSYPRYQQRLLLSILKSLRFFERMIFSFV